MFESLKTQSKLKDFEERLERLERAQKQLKLEWDDAYERLTRTAQRIVKRAQVVEQAEAAEAEEEQVEPELPGFGGLTERQRKIQNAILQQRSRRGDGLLPG